MMKNTDLYKSVKMIETRWDKRFEQQGKFNKRYGRGKEGYLDQGAMADALIALMEKYRKDNGRR